MFVCYEESYDKNKKIVVEERKKNKTLNEIYSCAELSKMCQILRLVFMMFQMILVLVPIN